MQNTNKKIVIESIGHFHPSNKIDNSFFTELEIGSDASWIIERVGIESRRSVLTQEQLLALRRGDLKIEDLKKDPEFMTIAKMSQHAWQMLKERAVHSTPNPSTIICGTSVPDYDIPANACTIGHAIGIEAASFDVNSACSSFVVNLHVASGLLKSGSSQEVAIFNPERYSIRLNYTDRASCVLFGDGCAAAWLKTDSPRGLEVVDTYIESMPSKFDMIQIPDGGHFYQNGQAVQKFAITRTMETTHKILERNSLKTDDVNYFIGHQANLRMITSAANKLGFNESQHLFNVDRFGNQGAAGAPAVLSMNWNQFRSGDLIVVAVVGSGLTWGAALFRFL
jgi:3-oxoacyl-[acyl-carrier-protein] synthase-3